MTLLENSMGIQDSRLETHAGAILGLLEAINYLECTSMTERFGGS
jgi:hypothetical protein